jgi:DNA-binding CsgD family transcriptional regulator
MTAVWRRRFRLEKTMKAIAFSRPLPIEAQDSLVELDLPQPEFGPRDLLVNVHAVSVNPVDTKVRGGARHQGSASDDSGKPRVLGWDAAGVVVGKGAAQLGEHAMDDALSAREIEVLRLIAAGNSNKLIADQLLIGEATVKSHVANILSKLGANDRAHAVTIGLKRGLIEI